MFLARVLWIWAFTTITPTTPALEVPPHPQSSWLSRLEHLEELLADHQAQWLKEKQGLQGDVRVLLEERHTMSGELEALQTRQTRTQAVVQSLQTMTQTLTSENQALRRELGEVQRQLVPVPRTQHTLQDPHAHWPPQPQTDPNGHGQLLEDDVQSRGGWSGQVEQTVAHHQDSSDVVYPYVKDLKDPHPHQVSDLDLSKQISQPYSTHHKRDHRSAQHVHTARSDDWNPLEAVTDRLAQQVTELEADVQALKTSDAQQHQDIQAARGSTFVQWGSSACAGSSELVYSGLVGGSWFDHSGSAANALCLSLTPKLLDLVPNNADLYSRLYGGEYETFDSYMDMDPVCAVCRSPHPSTVMVPGTNVCSSGWTLQYSGLLMAGYYQHPAASEYICVDGKRESGMHSHANENGYVLYYTKTQCGNLPCPPYENDKLVTCAVCSK